MAYEDLEKVVLASSAYMEIGMAKQTHGTIAFYLTASKTGPERNLERNQYSFFPKGNSMWGQCRSYLGGKPPVTRSRGMGRDRDFPPSPARSDSHASSEDGQAFLAFTTLVDGLRSSGEQFSSSKGQGDVLLLIDSESKSLTTPCRHDLINISYE